MAPQEMPRSKRQRPTSKPKTRAGLPLSNIVTTTIQFSEGMEFTGRTTDPKGNPAACADFHGIVTALMEDALLHCEERMITYTDQVVPLAQLGAMSKSQSQSKTGAAVETKPDTAADPADEQPKPQLAFIECYRNAVLINREVDPDRPILIQKKRVEAEEVLFYDRRTGDFTIPGKGMTLLYDRSDGAKSDGANPRRKNPARPRMGFGNRLLRRPGGPLARQVGPLALPRPRPRARRRLRAQGNLPNQKPRRSRPWSLTKITFGKGMRSQPGTGEKDDKLKIHWYEFFGDVQLGRAKVPDGQSTLDFDKLPVDGIFLTGQTVRFITEPPPVGSPASAPGRDFGKAWENAYFTSGENVLSTDVITYESEKDLVYAYGEGGRGVSYAQQHASGQPATHGTARAVRYHPKSGSMDLVENSSIQLIDKNTGVRPMAADAFDPDIKKKKPPKNGFRVPSQQHRAQGLLRAMTRSVLSRRYVISHAKTISSILPAGGQTSRSSQSLLMNLQPRCDDPERRPSTRGLAAQDSAQLQACDIAAAQDQADVFAGEHIRAAPSQPQQPRRPHPRQSDVTVSNSKTNSRGDLVIADEHKVVDHAGKHGEGRRKRFAGCESLGKRSDRFGDDSTSFAPRAIDRRRPLGLHANDLDCRIDRSSDRPGTEHSTAATDRDKNDIEVRGRFEQLKRGRCHSGDQQWLFGRVDVTHAVHSRHIPRPQPVPRQSRGRFRTTSAPKSCCRGHLERVCGLGHEDRRPATKQACGVCDRLAMVSRRGSDHPAGPRLGRQGRQKVDAAAHLEGTGRIEVLAFEQSAAAQGPSQLDGLDCWGHGQKRRDGPTCLEHVGERRQQTIHGAFL